MQFTHETLMVFSRLGIVFVHLIACCVAIGLVVTSDVAMVRQLLRGNASEKLDTTHLTELQRSVALALAALWISGVALVLLDMSDKGLAYLANPKLQAKIAIVCLLTINGVVLHRSVLPLLQKARSVLKLSFSQQMLALFAGSVSGVSWFYAAMLGVGRPLSWKYSFIELTAVYPLLVVGGFFSMLLLIFWAKYRVTGEYTGFQPTMMAGAAG